MQYLQGRCPFHWAGFGLSEEYLEKVVYEQIFSLVKHGNFSFSEAYSLPIGLRNWFFDRLIKYYNSTDENN